jgi:hypothetical protein
MVASVNPPVAKSYSAASTMEKREDSLPQVGVVFFSGLECVLRFFVEIFGSNGSIYQPNALILKLLTLFRFFFPVKRDNARLNGSKG